MCMVGLKMKITKEINLYFMENEEFPKELKTVDDTEIVIVGD